MTPRTPHAVTLIGMSGIGKSYWAERLQRECAFSRLSCDQAIGKALMGLYPTLVRGEEADISQWMRNPWEPEYAARAAEYLALEAEVTQDAIDGLTPDAASSVIDTTGSVIYLPTELLHRLRNRTTVVYLRHHAAHEERLYQTFLAHPKPLIWGACFRPQQGESTIDATRRCFRDLLRMRASQYASLAHLAIDAEVHQAPHCTVENFLAQLARL